MAQYIKQEMPNLNGIEEPQMYYRMKTGRNISSKEFVKRTTATLELKAFRLDPTSGITFVGRGSNKVYVHCPRASTLQRDGRCRATPLRRQFGAMQKHRLQLSSSCQSEIGRNRPP